MEPSLPFRASYRVRFDEAGADGAARPSTLIRYVQDCAWLHSEAAGFDRAWYAARGLGWLVRGLRLDVRSLPRHGATLDVTTRITGWRRMWCRREATVEDRDGRSIARAWTDWVLLDAGGRPVRIPPAIEAFAPGARPFTPTRVDLPDPGGGAVSRTAAVRAADVDPMGHLNNAAYLDLVTDAAMAAGRPIGADALLRLEYLRPALPGMGLRVEAWPVDAGLAVTVREEDASVDLLRARID